MKYLIIDKKQRVQTENKLPYASLRITEELKKKNLDFYFAYFDQIEIFFKDSKLKILVNGVEPSTYSHIIFRGHELGQKTHYETRTLITHYIEQKNKTKVGTSTKVQNTEATKTMPYYDKIWVAWVCAKNQIPFFKSYYKLSGDYSVEHENFSVYPLIIKHITGENDVRKVQNKDKVKKNVYKLENKGDLKQKYLKGKNLKEFFIQEFSDEGEDMRIFVSKNKIIGGWRRKAQKGFMTVSQGEYTIYNKPSKEITNLAIKTSKAFKADFIATDFMFKDGKPYLQVPYW